MNLNYIDIHSHLNLSPLSENTEAILAKMRDEGVGTITVGTGLETSKKAVQLAQENPDICWATVGIHPCECGAPLHASGEGDPRRGSGEDGEDFADFEELARDPKVVALGETGLDYFRDQSAETKQKQEELFKKHIELAIKVGKPLMLHVRASKGSDDAYYDALKILAPLHEVERVDAAGGRVRSAGEAVSANFHFFSGSKTCMEAIIAAGFTVSVDGPITFSSDYDDMIKAVPLDKVMVETDAPFAAPAPYRGKTCEPWMVVEVARKIAELKGLDIEVVRTQLLQNTRTFFGLDF